MASLTLATIQATPALSTCSTAGVVTLPNNQVTVWTPVGNFNDGDGSTMPVTFTTPNAGPFTPAFTVNAACTFTSQYATKGYDVVASLPIGQNGAYVPILRSVGHLAPSPIPNPPVPVPLQIGNFEFDAGLNLPAGCPLPFRFSGDFQWQFQFMNLPAITAVQTTRLEFSYARAAAPSGPSWVQLPLQQTKVNLGGIYPIGLLRQFFPSPPEFTQVPNLNQVYARWFAARVVQKVWSWSNPHADPRPWYDTLEGASSYNVSGIGGGFNLNGWLQAVNPSCNCYDLAAIVQLGCCLLQDGAGNELLDSRWVYQSPNGYILPCLLYGWAEAYPYPNGVNNPFFHNNPTWSGQPYIAPPTITGRSFFHTHAWIEVLRDPFDPRTRTVLDATTAVPDLNQQCFPETGARSRVQYAGAHVDPNADHTPGQSRTGNLMNFVLGSAPSQGSCYTNNDYYTTSPSFPPGALGRVGVWNAAGITPVMLLGNMDFLPPPLISEIELLLQKGQNPVQPEPGFNESAVADGALVPVIRGTQSYLVHQKEETHLAEGVTVLRNFLDGARYTETEQARLTVELQIYNRAADARAALIHALSSYQAPHLADHFSALSTPLGDTSLIDTHGTSLHLVHGNQYLHLRLVPARASVPDPSSIEPLEPIARRLDAYLSAHTLPPGQHRRPNLRLGTPGSARCEVGDTVTLWAEGDGGRDGFKHIDGESRDAGVVVCVGREGGTSRVRFFAVGEGEAELCLHVAQRETLAPGTETWKVRVGPAA